MKQKLYLETTIPSYLVANQSRDIIIAGHQAITHDWWKYQKQNYDIYISQFVIDEASRGNKNMAKMRLEVIANIKELEINNTVRTLTKKIISLDIIPEKAQTDAAHIAIASIYNMDLLLTWNCSHMANANIYPKIQKLLEKEGLLAPFICTPENF